MLCPLIFFLNRVLNIEASKHSSFFVKENGVSNGILLIMIKLLRDKIAVEFVPNWKGGQPIYDLNLIMIDPYP